MWLCLTRSYQTNREDKHIWNNKQCQVGQDQMLLWELRAAVLRRHIAWEGGNSCRGDTWNSKYRNHILWHLWWHYLFSSAIVWLFRWFSQVCPARLTVSSLFPSQLQTQSLNPSWGWLDLGMRMEPDSGFRASHLNWPVSSNHACVTKGFLFAFVSLPCSQGGQKSMLMLLSGEVTGEQEEQGSWSYFKVTQRPSTWLIRD